MVTLYIAILFGMFLGAYFYLARQQNNLVARSQGWNAAISMAEAGVEEALAQMNPGASLLVTWGLSHPEVDFNANGWGPPSGGFYGPMNRTMAIGSSTNSYSVVFTTDTLPIIYCTGYVTIPALSATLSRTVRVTTTNAALFSAGLVGIHGIDFKGNNITTDSTNLANPSLTQGTNGDIASISGFANVGNSTVNGTVYLGPTATNTIKSNGIITGGVSNDFNVEFESVVLPAGTAGWVAPTAGSTTISNVTYQYAFGPGTPNPILTNYVIDGVSATMNGTSIYVGTNTHVRLLVTDQHATPVDIRVAGVGTNAGQLTLYMNAPTFKISGHQNIDGGDAASFSYYGTTNNTAIDLSGSAQFIGTIYAPQANVFLNGGSGIWGAVVGNWVTMTGSAFFHFDESLVASGPWRYIANSWQEL